MPLKIGHRGAKGHAPENTLRGFAKALDLHCDGIELDLHRSADNQIVVIHDATTTRTYGVKSIVKHMTVEDLKKITPKDPADLIPTLPETMAYLNGACLLNLEVKVPQVIPLLAKIIEYSPEWKIDQLIISSFNWSCLLDLKAISPAVQLGALVNFNLGNAIDFAVKNKFYSIHARHQLLTEKNCRLMHSLGLRIFAWTVNSPEDIKRMLALGVDAIISDFPDRI